MKFSLSAFLLLVVFGSSASAAQLPLEDFLSQVAEKNENYKGSALASKGSKLREDDNELLLSPTLFADYNHLRDQKPTDAPIFEGTETKDDTYDIGISKMTDFGLTAKLGYNLSHMDIEGASNQFLTVPDYYIAYPKLELYQSLLQNGFGSAVRAQQDLLNSTNRANRYGSAFQATQEMVNAEIAYWQLAAARRVVELQKDFLSRAEKNLNWATRRAKLQLGDRSDMLQAQAAYELRQLELKSSTETEKAAALSFNSARNQQGYDVPEELTNLDGQDLSHLQAPARADMRLDVKAANEQTKIAIANADLAKDKAKPTLDIFGSYALNGRDPLQDPAIRQSLQTTNPTFAFGVKFSAPLMFGLAKDAREGASMEREGAELEFNKKLLDQEQSWKDLNTHLQDAEIRLAQAKALEALQKDKMENEHNRLIHGRSTTYQTLIFEQDYDQATLLRINTQAEVLRVYAQMKLFRGDL